MSKHSTLSCLSPELPFSPFRGRPTVLSGSLQGSKDRYFVPTSLAAGLSASLSQAQGAGASKVHHALHVQKFHLASNEC